MWCYQFYVEKQAEALLLTRLTGNSMAMNFKLSEMLRIYVDVVSFLRRKYAKDGLIVKTQNYVFSFSQSFTMTEESDSRLL